MREATSTTLEILVETIRKVTIGPNDLLVIRSPHALSDTAYGNIKRSFNEAFPHLKGRIVILEQGLDIAVGKVDEKENP